MNTHCVAGLLLLGWYLMVPPLGGRDGNLKPDPRRPLSDWQHIDTYVSADTCRAGLLDRLLSIQELIAEPSEKSVAMFQSKLGDCFASNDPRFKIKIRRPETPGADGLRQ